MLVVQNISRTEHGAGIRVGSSTLIRWELLVVAVASNVSGQGTSLQTYEGEARRY